MEVKLLSGALGAEIKGIDLKDTSDQNFKKINDLLFCLMTLGDDRLVSKVNILGQCAYQK